MLALSACTSQSDNHSAGVKEGELFSLDITTLDDEIHTVYFSDLMESVEIIQLDTASEAYMAINQLMVSDNYSLPPMVNKPSYSGVQMVNSLVISGTVVKDRVSITL